MSGGVAVCWFGCGWCGCGCGVWCVPLSPAGRWRLYRTTAGTRTVTTAGTRTMTTAGTRTVTTAGTRTVTTCGSNPPAWLVCGRCPGHGVWGWSVAGGRRWCSGWSVYDNTIWTSPYRTAAIDPPCGGQSKRNAIVLATEFGSELPFRRSCKPAFSETVEVFMNTLNILNTGHTKVFRLEY